MHINRYVYLSIYQALILLKEGSHDKAHQALDEKAKSLGLQVSWLGDETVQYIYARGEDIVILESFTYLGSIVQNNGEPRQEVLWPGPWCYGLAQHEYLALLVPVQMDKDSDF